MTTSTSTSSSTSSPSMSTSSPLLGGRRLRKSGGKSRKQRKMRGGKGASEWQLANVGTENQQWDNVFIKGGPFGAAVQNLAGTQPSLVTGAFPSAANLKLIQSAGSRRRKHGGKMSTSTTSSSSSSSMMGGKRRTKKGGYWGKVLSQALVPFSLWFAQNKYGTRKHRK